MPSNRPRSSSPGTNANRSQTGAATGSIINRVQVTPAFVRELSHGVRNNKLTAGQRDMTARILDTVAGERTR